MTAKKYDAENDTYLARKLPREVAAAMSPEEKLERGNAQRRVSALIRYHANADAMNAASKIARDTPEERARRNKKIREQRAADPESFRARERGDHLSGEDREKKRARRRKSQGKISKEKREEYANTTRAKRGHNKRIKVSPEEQRARTKEKLKQWRKENREKLNAQARESHSRRMKDPEEREKKREKDRATTIQRRKDKPTEALVRAMLGRIIRLTGAKKNTRTEEAIGFSFSEFRAHIERQLGPGMNWETHGKGPGHWNVDHIVPVSWFLKHGIHDPKLINRLENLRPLWWAENIQKKAKIEADGLELIKRWKLDALL